MRKRGMGTIIGMATTRRSRGLTGASWNRSGTSFSSFTGPTPSTVRSAVATVLLPPCCCHRAVATPLHSGLIKFRTSCPLLRRDSFLGPQDITWHEDNWDNTESKFIAFTLHDRCVIIAPNSTDSHIDKHSFVLHVAHVPHAGVRAVARCMPPSTHTAMASPPASPLLPLGTSGLELWTPTWSGAAISRPTTPRR